MTTWVLPALGCALVALTVVDVVWTVLWSGMGAGPISMVTTRVCRTTMRAVAQHRRRLLSVTGPLALLVIVLSWVSGLLLGFVLVLEFDPDALRSTTPASGAAGLGERAYFVGYTLFTLGNGGFAPTTGATQALTIVMNILGMFLITLSVTYLLPVVSASVRSRAFGSAVLALGDTPEDVVVGAWDGHRVRLDSQVETFGPELSSLAHQHLAYPVLHLFHSSDTSASAPLAVAVLDDTLSLLEAADPEVLPPAPARRQLRSSIDRYLDTYGPHVRAGASVPPPPSLEALVEAGVPLVEDFRAFQARLDGLEDHRSRTHSLVDAVGLDPPTGSGHHTG